MDTHTTELLRTSLRAVLATGDGTTVAKRLHDLGWPEAVADDPIGASLLLFDVRGEVLATADSLGPMLADAIGSDCAVLLPLDLRPEHAAARLESTDLVVDGVALDEPGGRPLAALYERPEGRRIAFIDSSSMSSGPAGGFDLSLGLQRVRGRVPLAAATCIDPPAASAAWEAAVAAGRWAVGAELVAIGRRVVADAAAYAGERQQFGRPIGSFQAVQHRLASAHAAVVGASGVVAEAARSGRPWDALVAKCLAGRAAEDACTQAQQVYGAIGFTWEHPFHRSLRRAYALDRILTGWRDLETEIGRGLRTAGVIPRIGQLR